MTVPSRRLRQFSLTEFEALDVEGADRAKAKALCAALEREIFSRVSGAGGARALKAFIADLNSLGHQLSLVKTDPGWTSYFQSTTNGARQFHIHVCLPSPQELITVMVLYSETIETVVSKRRAKMSKSEKARAETEDEFFARGLALNTGKRPYSSLEPEERLIACLHELEGGVSNGGFSTYLSNTGGARVTDAERFLSTIGARRTARLVNSVRKLFPRGFGAAFRRDALSLIDRQSTALEQLSGKFFVRTENIPILAMRYLKSRRAGPSRSKPAARRRQRGRDEPLG